MEDRSEQTPGKGFADIGREILFAARNELYLNLPYLDVALCALAFQPGGEVTLSLATDGETLYYDGAWLSDRYLRSRVLTNRAYLHVILHCMLRHLGKKQGKAPELWDLACDAAVESILDELNYPCLNEGTVPMKQKFWGECRREMKVLTAEGIYRHLLRRNLPPYELAQLQRVFLVDDHGLWAPEDQQDQKQQSRQDQKWQDLSEKTQTGLETVMSQQGAGGETVLEQVRVANREDVDYRAFLRRFAVPRKVNIRILQCDDQVRADTVIHDLEELKTYMENFQLAGGSATDFRPVFAYVAQLQAQGEFTNLRGLVYFTDGMGIYPKKRPPYDTAFVLLEEPPLSVQMPPWAIRLVLTEPALEKARQETQAAWTDEIDWDELPQL